MRKRLTLSNIIEFCGGLFVGVLVVFWLPIVRVLVNQRYGLSTVNELYSIPALALLSGILFLFNRRPSALGVILSYPVAYLIVSILLLVACGRGDCV